MPVDLGSADRVFAKIAKRYGDAAVHAGDTTPAVTRISTGSPELDLATGGGIPLGRWTHIWGGRSSGKTLTAWQVARNAMEMGLGVVYYNIEKQYTKEFAEVQGIDTSSDLFRIVETSVVEKVGDMCEALMGVYHVHIFDSLAHAVSLDALNAEYADWQMGLNARAWGKTIAKLHEAMDNTENAVIMINQARDSFTADGEHPPGGRAIDFASSMTIYYKLSKWLYRYEDGRLDVDADTKYGPSGMSEPEGIEMTARVEKSRVCRPLRTARMRYDFAEGRWQTEWELAKNAVYYELVQKSGSWYTLPDDTRIQGEGKFTAHLRSEEGRELAEQIRAELMKRAA